MFSLCSSAHDQRITLSVPRAGASEPYFGYPRSELTPRSENFIAWNHFWQFMDFFLKRISAAAAVVVVFFVLSVLLGFRDWTKVSLLERCPELITDEPRVKETHKSLTKGLFTPPSLRWDKRMINGYCCELSWTTTMVNVNIDPANEQGKQGRDFYFSCMC